MENMGMATSKPLKPIKASLKAIKRINDHHQQGIKREEKIKKREL